MKLFILFLINMLKLRDYQEEYIQELRTQISQGKNRLILCAPTGAGKTVMFSFMVSEHLKRGGKAIIFTHRFELLKQASGAFNKLGLKANLISGKTKTDFKAPLHVSMVETFNRRKIELTNLLQEKTLIIFDEAHLLNFEKIMPLINDSSIVIGATATPYRKPKEAQLKDFYHAIVHKADTPDLINKNQLTQAKSYGIPIDLKGLKKTATDYDTSSYYSENKTYQGVVKNWERIAKNTKTILFASNVSNSVEVCSEFLKKGYNAKHVDGTMGKSERKNIFDWFNNTPDAILCNCGIATTGFDQHDILTVILYRATVSLPLFLQMVGRGSRLSDNKTHFNILDFGNNISRFGFWEERREWKLEYLKKDKESVIPTKECPGCGYIMRLNAVECVECGHEFKNVKVKKEIELKRLERPTWKGKFIKELTVDELIQIEEMKKFKASFVWRILRSKGIDSLRTYQQKKGYKPFWLQSQIQKIQDNSVTNFIVK